LQTKMFASSLLGLAFLVTPAFGDFSVVNDFPAVPSTPMSANGVWGYGYSLNLSPFAFVSDTNATSNYFGDGSKVVGFYSPLSGVGSQLPTVLANKTGGDFTGFGVGPWNPTFLLLHPGSENQYSVIQFTAPVAGSYSIGGEFMGIATAGTTSDAHILLSGSTSVFSQEITGLGASSAHSFNLIESLSAGETVDFAVGFGDNNNYNSDSTGLQANMSLTPEPMFYGVLAIGLTGLYVAVRRRRA
jgi:hypothetical protein